MICSVVVDSICSIIAIEIFLNTFSKKKKKIFLNKIQNFYSTLTKCFLFLTSLIDAKHLFLDSICRYFQNLKKEGIAPLNPIPLLRTQSMKLVFSKTSSERNEMGFFQTS